MVKDVDLKLVVKQVPEVTAASITSPVLKAGEGVIVQLPLPATVAVPRVAEVGDVRYKVTIALISAENPLMLEGGVAEQHAVLIVGVNAILFISTDDDSVGHI